MKCFVESDPNEHWAIIMRPSAQVFKYLVEGRLPWIFVQSNVAKVVIGPYLDKSHAEAALERVLLLGQRTNWLVEGF